MRLKDVLLRMINFNNTKFVTSFASKPQGLEVFLDEVLIVGRSNCGKSSLINALANQKQLAFASSKPGFTKLLNYFCVDNAFYLVDAPGYGYAKKTDDSYLKFGKLMDQYFENNERLKLVIFLLDSRREPNEDDIDLYKFIKSMKINFVICMTKVDKLNMSEKSAILKHLELSNIKIPAERLFFTSVKDNKTLADLKKAIALSVQK